VAARIACDDWTHEAGDAGLRSPHETGTPDDGAIALLGDQQMRLGIDAVALELGEQIAPDSGGTTKSVRHGRSPARSSWAKRGIVIEPLLNARPLIIATWPCWRAAVREHGPF
jgi:hypothetical protein